MDNESENTQEEKLDEYLLKVVNETVNILYPNLKIFIEEKLDEIKELFQDLEDIRFNISTLSTVLAKKNIFSKEEFADCFKYIRSSFGVVNRDGTMKGSIIVTPYNWEN